MIKILEIGSPGIVALAAQVALTSGWYRVSTTGQLVYYDAASDTLYTAQGGIYIPLGYMNPAPKQVALAPGEKLKIMVSFKYSGPAVTGAILRYCVGVYGTLGFTEKMVQENTKNLPLSPTPAPFTDEYTFTMPTDIGSDWNDIYCKINGGSPNAVPQTLFGYENALTIIGIAAVISEFTISDFVKV